MAISFSQFIRESANARVKWSKTDLSIRDAAKEVVTHCKGMRKLVESGKFLFRGDYIDEPCIIDTTGSKRVSKDTKNLYQLMMDHQAEELGSAPRSSSLICATDKSTASTYGLANLVFPFDGTKISFVNRSDIFRTVVKGSTFNFSISTLDNILAEFLALTGYSADKFESIDKIDNHLSKFSDVVLGLYMLRSIDAFGRSMISNLAEAGIKFDNEDDKKLFLSIEHSATNQFHNDVKKLEKLIKTKKIDIGGTKLEEYVNIFSNDKKFTALSEAIFTANTYPITVKKVGSSLKPDDIVENTPHECWFTGKAVIMTGRISEAHVFFQEIEKLGWKVNEEIKEYYNPERIKKLRARSM